MAIIDQVIFEEIRDLVKLLPIDWEEREEGAFATFDGGKESCTILINLSNLLPMGCLLRDIRYIRYFLQDLRDEILGYESSGYLDTGVLMDACQDLLDFLKKYGIGEEREGYPFQDQYHPISTGDEREGNPDPE